MADSRLNFRHTRLKTGAAALAAVMFCALLSAPAHAVQHLVTAGSDWQSLGPRVRPGDEIILMPGRHRAAFFDGLSGTAEQPIIIRSADPSRPVEIKAEREGLRINRPNHIIIQDLVINGAVLHGLVLDGSPQGDPEPGRFCTNVTIRNVAINRTGGRGLRHALFMHALTRVRVANCEMNGWGGSAIEITNCAEVSIEDCRFIGRSDHGQQNGVRAQSGSHEVRIERCRFEDAGDCAVSFGAFKRTADRLPTPTRAKRTPNNAATPQTQQPPAQAEKEASFCYLDRSTVVGSQCAVAFIHADDCVARQNLIVAPRRCAIALVADSKSATLTSSKRNIFGGNLVFWQAGQLQKLAEISPTADTDSFVLETNLWWSGETIHEIDALGPLPGKDPRPQIMNVDPKLDQNLKPTAPEAIHFGP